MSNSNTPNDWNSEPSNENNNARNLREAKEAKEAKEEARKLLLLDKVVDNWSKKTKKAKNSRKKLVNRWNKKTKKALSKNKKILINNLYRWIGKTEINDSNNHSGMKSRWKGIKGLNGDYSIPSVRSSSTRIVSSKKSSRGSGTLDNCKDSLNIHSNFDITIYERRDGLLKIIVPENNMNMRDLLTCYDRKDHDFVGYHRSESCGQGGKGGEGNIILDNIENEKEFKDFLNAYRTVQNCINERKTIVDNPDDSWKTKDSHKAKIKEIVKKYNIMTSKLSSYLNDKCKSTKIWIEITNNKNLYLKYQMYDEKNKTLINIPFNNNYLTPRGIGENKVSGHNYNIPRESFISNTRRYVDEKIMKKFMNNIYESIINKYKLYKLSVTDKTFNKFFDISVGVAEISLSKFNKIIIYKMLTGEDYEKYKFKYTENPDFNKEFLKELIKNIGYYIYNKDSSDIKINYLKLANCIYKID